MTCLGIDRIYAYLDGELSTREQAELEAHIARCPACREAVEDRRRLQTAAREIPPLRVPPDFTAQVMLRLRLELVPLRDILIAASLGLAAMLVTMLSVFLWSGQSLFDFLVGLNHSALQSLQAFFVTCAKLFKTLILILRVLSRSFGSLLEALARSVSTLRPEVQAGIIMAVMIFCAGLFILIRKKSVIGDSR